MQLTTSALSLAIGVGLATTTTNAFVVPSTSTAATLAINGPSARSSSAAAATTTRSKAFSPLTPLNMATDADDEIERLRSMAANLRAEASALEVSFKLGI